MRRSTVPYLFFFTAPALCALACGGSDASLRPLGAACDGDAECVSGICGGGMCLDPDADDDLDGLVNGLERELGTDPLSADSDGDGISDIDELDPDYANQDTDGDGIPDGLESATADSDDDCVPDQLDAFDGFEPGALEKLVPYYCPLRGACETGRAALTIRCGDDGQPVCDASAVPGYEPSEATCGDGVDNDCDGATDAGGACGPAVTDLVLSAPAEPLAAGDALTLALAIHLADGTTLTGAADVVWTSDDSAVARVDGAGKISALAPGATDVHASWRLVTASAHIVVGPARVVALHVAPETLALAEGARADVVAGADFSDGASGPLDGVTWESSDAAVATVGDDGEVRGIGAGQARIRAHFGALEAEAVATVRAATCDDGVVNGDESDRDCGGATSGCPRCAAPNHCAAASDCAAGVCHDGACQDARCDDQTLNGGESDVDCGGPADCARCGEGAACAGATDCASGVCDDGHCAPPPCPTGEVRDAVRGCVDVDACADHPCGANAACTDLAAPAAGDASGRTCACDPGFGGDATSGCVDVDACADHPCGANATCGDLPAPAGNDATGRTCECAPGFAGDPESGCHDVNACADHACGANATCSDLPAPAADDASGRSCACKPGFGGDADSGCSDVDACASHACGANATCKDRAAPAPDDASGRTCTCVPGFGGDAVAGCIDVDACAAHACGANATCTDLAAPAGGDASGRTCACDPGFAGNAAVRCSDVNACSVAPCGANAACTDLAAPAAGDASGRTCACRTGYAGDPATGCADIDACAAAACGAHATCFDRPAPAPADASGRTCACDPGYSGDPESGCAVSEVDACATSPCGANAVCADLPAPAPDGPSGRRCTCKDGTTGDPESGCVEEPPCTGLTCPCEDDGDCTGGKVCLTEKKLCVDCLDDGDCPPDEECNGINQCQPRSTGGCNCDQNQVCDPSSTCVTCYDAGGRLNPGCQAPRPACDTSGGGAVCVECLSDDDCGRDQTCDHMHCVGGTTGPPDHVVEDAKGDRLTTQPAILDDLLYYSSHGRLYRFDGSQGLPIAGGMPPDNVDVPLTAFDEALYFAHATQESGSELWRYDGTTASSFDLQAGDMTNSSSPRALFVAFGALWFSADDGTHGHELWRYDGVTAPAMVADVCPGVCDGEPDQLVAFAGAVYFSADDGTHGRELWRFDGDGVALVADVNDGGDLDPRALTVYDGALYFAGDEGLGVGPELWRYDGTGAPESVAVADGWLDPAQALAPESLRSFDGALYFSALQPDVGAELARYDGTGAPTLVADIQPGPVGAAPAELTELDGALYFSADDGTHGRELWRSDGTATTLVDDRCDGACPTDPAHLVVFQCDLYFGGDEFGLYRLPGADGGTCGGEPESGGDCLNGTTASGTTACGLNGGGLLEVRCSGGAFVETATCVDPDACTNDDTRAGPTACGLNGAGFYDQTCSGGQWHDTTCVDPDECVDGAREPGATACGPGDAGTLELACVDGAWSETAMCVDGGFVYVAPGTFAMGSPADEPGRGADESAHQVTLTHGYWIYRTEVTQAEWHDLMHYYPSHFMGDNVPADDYQRPVDEPTWFSAAAYMNTLSARDGLTACYTFNEPCTGNQAGVPYGGTGNLKCPNGVSFVGLGCSGYRFPTEAEWEYAARAGTAGATYATGDETVPDIAWCAENADSITHPVATRAPNAWGLYDMLGNLYEWVGDWYGAYPGTVVDPVGPGSASTTPGGIDGARVLRGGGWSSPAASLRAALRFGTTPDTIQSFIGFRPVRSAP